MKLKRGLWVLASAAVHGVLLLLLLQAMLSPRGFFSLRERDEPIRVENLTYVYPATPEPVRPASPRAPPRVQVVPVAPIEVPTTLPVAPKATVPQPVDSVPSRAAAGSPTGVPGLPTLNPANPDPKLFGATPPIPEPPKRTGLDAIEFSLDSTLRVKNRLDSIARTKNPADWTVGEGDKKFGIDQRWIYLGKFKLPSMLLALIPLKGVQGNPGAYERSKTLGVMASEVRERGERTQSQRAEINAINERMTRERNAKLRAAAAAAGSGKVPP